MRAMILAAGKSTRLGALGQALPKPLVPVCGTPAIVFGLAACARAGLTEVVINLHHYGSRIVEAVGNGELYGVNVRYSHEQEILGTGGGIAHATQLLLDETGDDAIVVLNGKVVAELDLAGVIAAHRASGAEATLVLRDDPQAARWGPIGTDPAGRIVSLLDARAPSSSEPVAVRMFTGVYVLARSLWSELRPVFSDTIRDLCMPALRAGRHLQAFVSNGYFAENSTPERYWECNMELLRRPELLRSAPRPLTGIDPGAVIAIGARILPPVRIEAGVVVEAGAEIGPSVALCAGAHVLSSARLRETVVWPGATVGGESCGVIVTENDTISASASPRPPA